MSTNLNFNRDLSGGVAYAPQFPTDIFSATLTNGSAQSVTVPQNHTDWIVSFSYQPGTNVWVAQNTTAAIPVGATFAATHSELNPAQRTVYSLQNDGKTATTLSFITDAATADVEVSFYAISSP